MKKLLCLLLAFVFLGCCNEHKIELQEAGASNLPKIYAKLLKEHSNKWQWQCEQLGPDDMVKLEFMAYEIQPVRDVTEEGKIAIIQTHKRCDHCGLSATIVDITTNKIPPPNITSQTYINGAWVKEVVDTIHVRRYEREEKVDETEENPKNNDYRGEEWN